jgi:8-oxo-dGTP pyrophosphatase MutT (NUDIX family)
MTAAVFPRAALLRGDMQIENKGFDVVRSDRGDWLAALRQRAGFSPARPREPLRLAAGDAVIGSIERSLAERMAGAGLPLARDDARAAWHVSGDPEPALDAIARWLDAERLCSRWRNELLDVVDSNGERVARIERAAARALGIATFAVHLVGRAADGGWWIQQRAHDKSVDPGLWDTLMGGLVTAGESSAATLARETAEEAELAIEDLESVRPVDRISVHRPVDDGYMIEHIEIFEAVVPAARVPLNRDGEVERFECVSTATLVDRLRADAFTLEAALILVGALERSGLASALDPDGAPGLAAAPRS